VAQRQLALAAVFEVCLPVQAAAGRVLLEVVHRPDKLFNDLLQASLHRHLHVHDDLRRSPLGDPLPIRPHQEDQLREKERQEEEESTAHQETGQAAAAPRLIQFLGLGHDARG